MRREFSVECPLTRLTRDFQQFGLVGESQPPWVIAQLDQHSAAVRSSIESDGIGLDRRSLGYYVRGLLDGMRERGWETSESDYDWETLRLMAVCSLATERGLVG